MSDFWKNGRERDAAETIRVIWWCLMALLVVVVFFFALPSFIYGQSGPGSKDEDPSALANLKEFWLFRLLLNLLGYASIIVPGYLIIRYVRSTKYLEHAGPGCMTNLIRLCVSGSEPEATSLEGGVQIVKSAEEGNVFLRKVLLMLWCFCGLQISYLTWGLLQERIMSYKYGANDSGELGERFTNSLFLVFMNRILAFIVASLWILCRPQPRHVAPLYKYSFSSFSNIMSSWCQYEALKFVSFPTQTLAKSCKVIPTMLMGKVLSKKTYQMYEYVTAVIISIGVAIFMLSSGDSIKHKNTVTTSSGLIILAGYLIFDAFTSNWQGKLFQEYKMSSVQMMAGVNMFSVLFTSVSLIEQGGFVESMAFSMRHPDFILHIVILSICSAIGQLFIYYTIGQFGAVVFSIIMTIRMGISILLSCIMYGHPVTVVGILGILVTFAAVFARTFLAEQSRRAKPRKVPQDNLVRVVTENPKT